MITINKPKPNLAAICRELGIPYQRLYHAIIDGRVKLSLPLSAEDKKQLREQFAR